MKILLPKQIDVIDEKYVIRDIDNNMTYFSVLSGGKEGLFDQKKDDITHYIVGDKNKGRLFDVSLHEKVLLCHFRMNNDCAYILKKERAIEVDFSTGEDYASFIDTCLMENKGHGLFIRADDEVYELQENCLEGDKPNLEGALSVTVTPFLVLKMDFFGLMDTYCDGLIVLNLESGTPIITMSYLSSPESSQEGSATEPKKKQKTKGFERFCRDAGMELL